MPFIVPIEMRTVSPSKKYYSVLETSVNSQSLGSLSVEQS